MFGIESKYLAYSVVTGSIPRGMEMTQDDVDNGYVSKVSDKDIRGFFVTPFQQYFRLEDIPSHIDGSGDEKYYDAVYFARLLMKPSPEHIELLFVPEQFVIVNTPLSKFLRYNREKLLCKDLIKKQLGAAQGEWKQYQSQLDRGEVETARKSAASSIRRLLTVRVVEEAKLFPVNMGVHVEFLKNVRRGIINTEIVEKTYSCLLSEAERHLEDSKLPQKPNEKIVTDFLALVSVKSKS